MQHSIKSDISTNLIKVVMGFLIFIPAINVPAQLPLSVQAEFHENAGCPINSSCTKEQGQQKLKWIDLFEKLRGQNNTSKEKIILKIEQYRQSEGIPIEVLGKENFIHWDSSCPLPKGIFPGEIFLKNSFEKDIDQLIKNKFFLSPVISINQAGVSAVFYGPLNQYPVSFTSKNPQQVHYILDEEGTYFGLSIDESGKWKVVDPQKFPKQVWVPMNCTPPLVQNWSMHLGHLNSIFKSLKCYEVFNTGKLTSKPVATFIIPTGCH
jgi:hypothetical protein